jgi:hypothetical protein
MVDEVDANPAVYTTHSVGRLVPIYNPMVWQRVHPPISITQRDCRQRWATSRSSAALHSYLALVIPLCLHTTQ